MTKPKPFQVYLDPIVLTALKIKAAKEDTSSADIVRTMIERGTIKEVTALKLDIEIEQGKR